MLKVFPALCAMALAATNCQAPCPVATFTTPAGEEVAVSMIKHASLAISYKGTVIQIDPVLKMGGAENDYSVFPKADYILVTHEHGDHFDPAAIEQVSKPGTRIVLNPASQAKLGRGDALANYDTTKLGSVGVLAVPAYNITEDRLQFHPKGRDNGYILDFDGLRIYISGDTEDIDEMASFGPVDVAFLSANQPYTMTTTQCVEAAMALSPKVLIPYHLSDTDMQEIKNVLDSNDSGIQVMLFEELR